MYLKIIFFLTLFVFRAISQRYLGNENSAQPNIKEIFAWKQLTYNIQGNSFSSNLFRMPSYDSGNDLFVFPTESEEDTADPTSPIGPANDDENKFFIQYNNVPMGVDRWNDKLFVTVPRRRYGIPSTLNYLSLRDDTLTKSPGLRPYPSLRANTFLGKSNAEVDRPLVSVYRTRVDSCDRLWMVDTGLLEVPDANRQIQPPAIVVYDLTTNTLLRRFELPESVLVHNTTSGLASITVDVEDCRNTHAFIPDLAQYGLIVYSFANNKAWRIRHNYFYLDPQGGDYEVNGLKFQWNDGIFSIVLTNKMNSTSGSKTAVFHPMSGTKEYTVPAHILKDETLATRDYHGEDFQLLGDRGNNTQTAMHDIHERSGVFFYGQVGRNAIACWNAKKPFSAENHHTIFKDDVLLAYPSDLHVDSQDEIWVMSNRLPIYNYAQLNPSDTNFRIYRLHAPTVIAGTPCEARRQIFSFV